MKPDLSNTKEQDNALEDIYNISEIHHKTKELHILKLVDEVQERLKGCDLFLTPKTDFNFLAKFIRVKKFDTEKAVNAIKNYYDHIYRNLRRIKGMRPSDVFHAWETRAVAIFKNKYQGTKIGYINLSNWDTQKSRLVDLIGAAMFLSEELALIEELQPFGNVMLFDIAGLNFSQLKQLTISNMKYLIQVAVDGLPSRLEEIHVINAPMIYWPIHKLVVKLLPQKIRNRFHVHSNLNSLHTHVNRSILPHSLGGVLEEEDAIDTEFVMKVLAKNKCYEEYWCADLSAFQYRTTADLEDVGED